MSFLGSLGSAIAGGLAGFVSAGPWGAAAGAAGGLLAGIGSDSDSSDSYGQKLALQKDQQKYQMEENQKDRDFNSNQAQLNREFQTSEREATQEWNKASAQVQRLQDAGLNASAILGGSGAGSAAGISSPMQGSQAQASSSPLPAYPIDTAYETLLKAQSTQGAYLKAVSGAFKDMSDAGVNDAKKDQLWASAANLLSESRLNELKSEAQDLSNQIVKLTGKEKAASEIGVLVAQAQLLMQQKETEVQKGNLTAEQVTTEVFKGLLTRLEGVLKEKDIQKAMIDLKFWEQEWKERLENIASSTEANRAGAEESRTASVLNRDTHARNEFNRLVGGFDKNGRPLDMRAFVKQQDAFEAGLEKAINESDISESQKSEARAIARRANIAADFETFNQTIGALTSIVGAGAQSAFAWSTVSRAGSLGKLAAEQATKLHYENMYGTTSTTEVYDARGRYQGSSVTKKK